MNGNPIDLGATYRVALNNFLADGGDNFTVFRQGTNRFFGEIDLDAFATWLTANNPVAGSADEPDHARSLDRRRGAASGRPRRTLC